MRRGADGRVVAVVRAEWHVVAPAATAAAETGVAGGGGGGEGAKAAAAAGSAEAIPDNEETLQRLDALALDVAAALGAAARAAAADAAAHAASWARACEAALLSLTGERCSV